MKYKIVLISDFHFCEEYAKNIIEKKEKFMKSIFAEITELDNVVIIVGGDIANKGKEEEYVLANEFFNYVDNELNNNNISHQFIFVPGNHDVCMDTYDENDMFERNKILSKNNFYMDELIENKELFLKGFENYFEFVKQYESISSNWNKIFFIENEIKCPGHKIKIVGFNSSLLYDLSETKVKLIVDEKYVDDNLIFNKNEIVIYVSHYPLEWFNRNKKCYYNVLQKNCDFLCVGHEHDPEIISTNKNVVIKMPTFYSDLEQSKLGYQLLSLDTCTTNYSIKEYIYNGNIYSGVEKVENGILKKTICFDESLLPINDDEYRKLVNTKLLPFENEKFNNLSDVYICPSLSFESEKDNEIIIKDYIKLNSYSDLLNYKISIITGSYRIGKTFILKKMFDEYYRSGYIPVYINIKKSNDNIYEKYESVIKKFYGDHNLDFVKQNNDKVILLIDNLKLTNKTYECIINELNGIKCHKIILTLNKELCNYDFTLVKDDNVKIYNICKFGNTERYEAIIKWTDKMIENSSKSKDNNIYLLKKIMDKSIVNSNLDTPELIWIFLDAYNNNMNEKLMKGSKGVYYDYLFSKYIMDIDQETGINDTNFIESYLSLYSYCILNNIFNSTDEINKKYLEDYEIQPKVFYQNINKLEEALLNKNIAIKLSDDKLEFINSYALPYFSALYYINNFEEEEDKIMDMIEKLDDINIANTLLFIVRKVRITKLLKEIISKNNNIFSEFHEAKCQDETKLFDEYILSIHDVKKIGTVKENNLELYSKMDKQKNKKQMKRELNVLEKEILYSARILQICNEIIPQSINKQALRNLINAMYGMVLRRLEAIIAYAHFKLEEIVKSKLSKDEKNKIFNENLRNFINLAGSLVISIAENTVPSKYYYLLDDLTKEKQDNLSKLLNILIKIFLIRNTENELNYQEIVNLRNYFTKNDFKFCQLVLQASIHIEINYVGMNDKVSNKLLSKLNEIKINKSTKDPVRYLNLDNQIKKINIKKFSKK